MRKDDALVMNIYRMNARRGCLLLIVKGKKPLKILDLLHPLPFVGWIKQLSMAIDTGADQNCKYDLECLDTAERVLKCRFAKEIVALELCFKQQPRMKWEGSAREFAAAVDRMIARLPKFF
ncbi:hypothetical protein ABIE26_003237 [Pedobacter africanus]|uniref:Uncharacterized protein n=1 Tax=Pedobacter africanus TaxID=151894 RepID=A0ACC6KZT8_9SPHI|nr:hypothetical protein [Pedobacter africanus]MDR6784591.1 hypothetical protein [Pedobacter africanus]